MEEWKEYRLGDFMEFNPKISLKKDIVARKITMDQLVPHSRDIYSWTYEPYSGGAKFQNGDTIMARITPCLENGKHAFISLLDENEIAYGSTEYIVIRGRKGISDNLFVYYLTHFPSFKDAAIKSMVGTSGRQRAQVDVLENLTMKLPSIAEQKSIADILTKLDDKIAVNKQINDNFYFAFLEVILIWLLTSHRNDNLEQQAQALFKSWFIDFEPFRGQPFVESELGMIPEGWRVVSLDKMTSKFGTGLNPRKNFKLGEGNNYYVTIKNMRNNRVYLDDRCDKVNDDAIEKINKRSNLQKGDLLFSGIGTIGRVALIKETPTNWNTSESVFNLHPSEIVSSEFLYILLLSNVFQQYVKIHAQGGVQQGIRMASLKDYKMAIPEYSIMREFDKKIAPIVSLAKSNDNEADHLASLRDTLLPRLMSGQLMPEL